MRAPHVGAGRLGACESSTCRSRCTGGAICEGCGGAIGEVCGGGIGEGAADGSRAVLSSSDHSSTTSTASAVADWKAEATSSSVAEWNTEPRL